MTAYKKYVRIKDPNNLVLTDLPFRAGQVVEVVVIGQNGGEPEEQAGNLQALLKETQAHPLARAMSEDDIAAEIEAYRTGR